MQSETSVIEREITHRLPADLRDFHVMGWDHYLPRLATAAAGGDPGPDEMAEAIAAAEA